MKIEEHNRYDSDGEEHVVSMLSDASTKTAKFIDYFYYLNELMENQLDERHAKCVRAYVVQMMEGE